MESLPQAEYAGIEVERILPNYKGYVSKNDRTCWNRTASNVGDVVFGQRGPITAVSVSSSSSWLAGQTLPLLTRPQWCVGTIKGHTAANPGARG